MIDLNSNYFNLPENDRYVDYFFTDQKEEQLLPNIVKEEGIY